MMLPHSVFTSVRSPVMHIIDFVFMPVSLRGELSPWEEGLIFSVILFPELNSVPTCRVVFDKYAEVIHKNLMFGRKLFGVSRKRRIEGQITSEPRPSRIWQRRLRGWIRITQWASGKQRPGSRRLVQVQGHKSGGTLQRNTCFEKKWIASSD